MLTILVANTKGGCGKTTIATQLAAGCALAGHRTVIADVDRQRSATGWAARRPPGAPAVDVIDWSKGVSKKPRGTERLIIDAPAAMTKRTVEELVGEAHVIVLPVLPSIFDEAATARFLKKLDDIKRIRKQKTAVAVVGNRIRARTKAAERLDKFLEGVGHRVVAQLRDSALYAEAATAGLSIFDIGGRRASAPRGDWVPLLGFIDSVGAPG